MKKLSSLALVGIAIVLAAASRSYAAEHGGHAGHSPAGHFESHRGFGEHFRPDGRHEFARRAPRAFVAGPFYWAPGYSEAVPYSTYYYYCPSYGEYYPTVESCPEDWVAVPG